MSNDNNILQVEKVSKSFGGLNAFEEISFNIKNGEIVGLIGPNGAGKTTLINCITGVYRPTEGQIYFQNEPIVKLRPHKICRLGIGRTFQIPRPFINMSVYENLKVCSHHGNADLGLLLEMVGLWDKRNLKTKNLTFQERRLLELSRALAVDPKLLLLDETMAGLNDAETMQMMLLLKRIHNEYNVTVLWIEHVMKAIMGTAHRIIVLHQGRLIAEGEPKKIANNKEVIEAYLGEEYCFDEEIIRC